MAAAVHAVDRLDLHRTVEVRLRRLTVRRRGFQRSAWQGDRAPERRVHTWRGVLRRESYPLFSRDVARKGGRGVGRLEITCRRHEMHRVGAHHRRVQIERRTGRNRHGVRTERPCDREVDSALLKCDAPREVVGRHDVKRRGAGLH